LVDKLFIKRLVVDEFEYEKPDIGYDYGFNLVWRPGEVQKMHRSVLRIFTDDGEVGEYCGGVDVGITSRLSRFLIGKNAFAREYLWSNMWRALRHEAGAGLAPIDIAIWDLTGKHYNAPIHKLLGYYRKSLPAYASTTHACNLKGGLDSPEAYADFAEECMKIGYQAFKMHGWGFDTSKRLKQEVASIHAIRERVGSQMDLMTDPACEYPTFANALKIGKACDEDNFFWLEDPFRDGGISAYAHRQLRRMIKTPLLMGEHLRMVYPKVDFLIAEGTDYMRGDIYKDGGITGLMKVAHAVEGFGLDIELHGGSVPIQHCMAAIRNTNYLEWGLVHPKIDTWSPDELYLSGFKSRLHAIDSDGCITVPEGPGLGVELNWDFIEKHRTGQRTFE